jgi:hypothetical protein
MSSSGEYNPEDIDTKTNSLHSRFAFSIHSSLSQMKLIVAGNTQFDGPPGISRDIAVLLSHKHGLDEFLVAITARLFVTMKTLLMSSGISSS